MVTSESDAINSRNVYLFMTTEDKKLQICDLENNKQVFKCGKIINKEGKVHYSNKLDNKGHSQVQLNSQFKKNIGDNNKIQKKAYRTNTQSKQTDGLFKLDQFQNRTSFLNHSRVNFNITRPTEVGKNGEPITSTAKP